jgi:hypothetical protein
MLVKNPIIHRYPQIPNIICVEKEPMFEIINAIIKLSGILDTFNSVDLTSSLMLGVRKELKAGKYIPHTNSKILKMRNDISRF